MIRTGAWGEDCGVHAGGQEMMKTLFSNPEPQGTGPEPSSHPPVETQQILKMKKIAKQGYRTRGLL